MKRDQIGHRFDPVLFSVAIVLNYNQPKWVPTVHISGVDDASCDVGRDRGIAAHHLERVTL